MPGSTSFLKYWLPVILWMAVIFSGSTEAGSSRNTSRLIGPLLRWLKPDISEVALDRMVHVVRKAAHLTEYAVLAALCWRAVRSTGRHGAALWCWRDASVALLICALYAASDEFHQHFVKSRDASARDVLLDTCGATLGLLALSTFTRRRKPR